MQMPASFMISYADNVVEDNVAAGSERLGFFLAGQACSGLGASTASSSFKNNTVHSSVAGIWLASGIAGQNVGCTELANTTIYLSWDFGVITCTGIETHVRVSAWEREREGTRSSCD